MVYVYAYMAFFQLTVLKDVGSFFIILYPKSS